jgi:hypothetical protein
MTDFVVPLDAFRGLYIRHDCLVRCGGEWATVDAIRKKVSCAACGQLQYRLSRRQTFDLIQQGRALQRQQSRALDRAL